MQSNIDAVLQVMQFIYENIMYAELNTKSDYCQICGFDGEIEIKEDKDGGWFGRARSAATPTSPR